MELDQLRVDLVLESEREAAQRRVERLAADKVVGAQPLEDVHADDAIFQLVERALLHDHERPQEILEATDCGHLARTSSDSRSSLALFDGEGKEDDSTETVPRDDVEGKSARW